MKEAQTQQNSNNKNYDNLKFMLMVSFLTVFPAVGLFGLSVPVSDSRTMELLKIMLLFSVGVITPRSAFNVSLTQSDVRTGAERWHWAFSISHCLLDIR